MTTFFVGQRVRVTRLPIKEHCRGETSLGAKVGDEGIVVGTPSHPNMGFVFQNFETLSVLLDGYGRPGMGPSYCFEPILPEGHRICESDFKQSLDSLLERVSEKAA